MSNTIPIPPPHEDLTDEGDKLHPEAGKPASGIWYRYFASQASLLANYPFEQGTWTPIYVASGCTIDSYSTQRCGYYTKMGRVVHVQGLLRTNQVSGGGANVLTVQGFPHKASTDAFGVTNAYQALAVGFVGGFAADHPHGMIMGPGTTYAELHFGTASSGAMNTPVQSNDMTTGAAAGANFMIFGGTYFTTA